MAYLKNVLNVGENQPFKHVNGMLAYDSYVFADGTLTNDASENRYVQPGTVVALITSGGDAGKVGAYYAGAADGRQTAANIVGVLQTALISNQLKNGDADVSVAKDCYVDKTKLYIQTGASALTQGDPGATVTNALRANTCNVIAE